MMRSERISPSRTIEHGDHLSMASKLLNPKNAVVFSNVVKRMALREALSSVSFAVPNGTVFGLVGANGAGKTTTLRLILGLLAEDSGTIQVLGGTPSEMGIDNRRRIGVLLETDGLYSRLSAMNNLRFYAEVWHMPPAQALIRVKELLLSFNLWDRRNEKVATWSRGMRIKLALARALLHRPALLLLDEPFAGLDPLAANDFRAHLAQLARDEGVTAIISSHDLAHVEQVCDHIAVLQAGQLLYCGPPAAMRADADGATSRIFVRARNLSLERLNAMVSGTIITAYQYEDDGVVLTCSPEQRDALGSYFLLHQISMDEMSAIKTSLERDVLALLSDQRS